jgi:hypothetical protein
MRGFMQTLRSEVTRNVFNNNFIRQMRTMVVLSKNACLGWFLFYLRIPVEKTAEKKS